MNELLPNGDILNTAIGLIQHKATIISQTPCSVRQAASILTAQRCTETVSQAENAIKHLSLKFPSNIIVENEGSSGNFLIFYFTDVLMALTGLTNNLTHSDVVNSSLDDILNEEPQIQTLKKELKQLTLASSGLETLKMRSRRMLLNASSLTLICNLGSWKDCLKANRTECAYKIHFERILDSHVDSAVDDCSYLDTCFKGKQCKFAHYKVKLPERFNVTSFAEPCLLPPQYINADLLSMNLSHLGNDFKAMIIDPPWDIHTNPKASGTGCSDMQLLNLEIEKLQTDGIVFLWVTGRVLEFGRHCLEKWGYTDLEELLWLKTNQLGRTICTGRTGHWLNHTKEHVLVGVKGNTKYSIQGMMNSDVIVSTTLGKSQKPKELYTIIENMVGLYSKKIELFGRKSNIRPGWLTIGNELGKTSLIDPELKRKLRM